MKRVLWICSRHEMAKEQVASLKNILGDANVSIEKSSVEWSATEDVEADEFSNTETWKALDAEEYDAIFGVFPVVAISSLKPLKNRTTRVFASVAKSVVIAYDGRPTKKMKFLRWQEL